MPIIALLLTLFVNSNCAAPVSSRNAVALSQFATPPGLYFNHYSDALISGGNWNVLAYFDLKGFYNEYFHIENGLNEINNICMSRLLGNGSCGTISSYLRKRVEALRRTNALVFVSSKRKRALMDIVGNVVSDLFGVLDSRFGEKYARDMSQLRSNDEHLMLLMKNHTSIVESTLNILKHNDDEMEKQTQHLNTIVEEVKMNQNLIEAYRNWDDALIYLSHMITAYEQQQNEILRVTTESKRNAISHTLLTPPQIENQMEIIANRFIVPEELDIYTIGRVSYYRTANQYIFKVSIGLYKPESYRIFNFIPVPIRNGREYLWISNTFTFMITTTDKQYYQYLDRASVIECVSLPRMNKLVCEKPTYFYTANRPDCTWNIFNHFMGNSCDFRRSDSFLFVKELQQSNRFLYVSNKNIKINAVTSLQVGKLMERESWI